MGVLSQKASQYLQLVQERKACRACSPALTNPADFPELDSDAIGPWTLWHGDLDAKLVVVGQDWDTADGFRKAGGRDHPGVRNPTNERLVHLLAKLGLDARGGAPRGLFFTNAVLCLKQDSGRGMQEAIGERPFRNCAMFLRRQLEIVKPRYVVTLGRNALRTVLRGFKLPLAASLKPYVDADPIELPTGTMLRPMYHCGRAAENMKNGRRAEEQEQDWNRFARLFLTSGTGRGI
jgi:uracil-DNA glycosylase